MTAHAHVQQSAINRGYASEAEMGTRCDALAAGAMCKKRLSLDYHGSNWMGTGILRAIRGNLYGWRMHVDWSWWAWEGGQRAR